MYYDAKMDKVYSDSLYAFMYHEVMEAKEIKRNLKFMEDELLRQEEYDRRESGYYEWKELERRMNEAAQEQILYMETHKGFIKDLEPYVPRYVAYVERIDKLLKAA
jgi:hypothetical protein